VKRAAQQKRTRLPEAPLAPLGTMKFAEKRFLQVLLNNTDLQLDVLPGCSVQDFRGLVTEKIFAVIMDNFRNGQISTFETLHTRFAEQPEQPLLAELQIEEIPEDLSRESADSCYSALQALRLAHEKQEILRQIDDAALRRDDERLNELIARRARVDRELVALSSK